MKYLVLAVVLFVAWKLWRRGRASDALAVKPNPPPASASATAAHDARPLRPCAWCGVHAQESDMLRGPHGWYCQGDHQRQHEAKLARHG